MDTEHATILLVDDEPMLLEIFGEWLLAKGFSVLRAADGAIALEILTSNPVDLIVSDVRMPVMDGITLLRSIRESGASTPKFILMTGFSGLDPREAADLPVDAFLYKPIKMAQFLEAVRNALSTT